MVKIATGMVAIATTAILAGCGSGTTTSTQSPHQGTIVVYSPHGPDVLSDYETRFEAAYPGIDVQTLDMGSQEVYARVKGERNRPHADIWWGAPATMFMQAAAEGLLAAYRPSWASAVPDDCHDPHDLWYGSYRSPLAIMYNTRGLAPDTLPKTWDDLLLPEWRGRIAMRKPLPSGTMRTFIGAMILRAPSEEEGIAWLKRLHESTEAYLDNPEFLYQHMKKREDLISVWLMPDAALQRQRNQYPFDCVVPPDTPVLTEGIAIIKDAPNREWAERFYEFVTSPESLAHQAHAYAKMPTRNDLDPATLPDWLNALDIKPMAIDWTDFASNEKMWCERWAKEVFNKP